MVIELRRIETLATVHSVDLLELSDWLGGVEHEVGLLEAGLEFRGLVAGHESGIAGGLEDIELLWLDESLAHKLWLTRLSTAALEGELAGEAVE